MTRRVAVPNTLNCRTTAKVPVRCVLDTAADDHEQITVALSASGIPERSHPSREAAPTTGAGNEASSAAWRYTRKCLIERVRRRRTEDAT